MHEPSTLTTPTPLPVDPVESIVASAGRLAGELRGDIPGWLAAELTIGQLRLLARLSRHGPISMSGVADWLGTGLPSATGAVERLERHGLVERRHATDDRRVVEVHLTDQANELVAQMAGVRLEVIRSALAVLKPAELAELARLLATIISRREGTRP
jgi:DNA-binding MarR family transcriptional regulator